MRRVLFPVMVTVLLTAALLVTGCSSTPVPTSKPAPATTAPPTATPSPTATAKPSPTTAPAATTKPPPQLITWTSYDIGSAGYTQSSAVAEGVLKKFGVKMRLIPAGTDLERLAPVRLGRADFTALSTATWFAAEGLYDFSSLDWGPQSLMMVWRCGSIGGTLVTAKDANIRKPADLKGKRVYWVPGSPAINAVNTALLAFAGLTWQDVKRVEFASSSAAYKAFVEGKVDAGQGNTSVAIFTELDASPHGVWWPEMPHSDKEALARVNKVLPMMAPAFLTEGPGIQKQLKEMGKDKLEIVAVNSPNIVAYANANADLVYFMAKALNEAYPEYSAIFTLGLRDWEMKKSVLPAGPVPYHPGAVKYFKEKGIWTSEFESWNNDMLKKQQALTQLWDKALAEAADKKIARADFPKFWNQMRADAGFPAPPALQ